MKQSSIIFEPNEFTLHVNPNCDDEFPIDKAGELSLTYAGKQYKFKKEYIKYSKLLQDLLESDEHLDNFTLGYEYSPEAFRIVMKILYGFKDVIISDQRLLQVYSIIEEMGIIY